MTRDPQYLTTMADVHSIDGPPLGPPPDPHEAAERLRKLLRETLQEKRALVDRILVGVRTGRSTEHLELILRHRQADYRAVLQFLDEEVAGNVGERVTPRPSPFALATAERAASMRPLPAAVRLQEGISLLQDALAVELGGSEVLPEKSEGG